jgi:hypothetical protein
MLRVQEPEPIPEQKEADFMPRDSRQYVRLRLEDQKLLKARALVRGVTLPRIHIHQEFII